MPRYISPLVELVIAYKDDLKSARLYSKGFPAEGAKTHEEALDKFATRLRALESFSYHSLSFEYTAEEMVRVSSLLRHFCSSEGLRESARITEDMYVELLRRIIRKTATEPIPPAARDELWAMYAVPDRKLKVMIEMKRREAVLQPFLETIALLDGQLELVGREIARISIDDSRGLLASTYHWRAWHKECVLPPVIAAKVARPSRTKRNPPAVQESLF